MRVFLLITFLVITGCAKDTQSYYIYPCGIEIDSCRVEVEGQRSREEEDKAIQMIKKITGLEVPRRAMYHSDEVQDIIDALRKKGYDAEVYPMDVS